MRVRGGRKLGIAEFGTPDGQPIVWLHGTPGARRQIPEEARKLADARGLRIVGIDRPGVGLSTAHQYEDIFDFVTDLEIVVDQLGIERFATIGLSGGAPVRHGRRRRAARPRAGGRCARWRGAERRPRLAAGRAGWASPSGSSRCCRSMRHPSGVFLTGVRARRSSHSARRRWSSTPASRRPATARCSPGPDVKEMFLDDLSENGGRSMRALVADGILFTRDWGFEPHDIEAPIFWWHGDADNIVPLAHAEWLVPRLKHGTLFVRHDESHLGGLGIATEVIDHVTRW